MTNKERIRESLLGVPTPDYFRQRAVAGWRPVAMIWERAIEATAEGGKLQEEIPYGMQVGADCCSLEESPSEKQVIVKVIEGVVQDQRLSQIAAALNHDGLRTRSGDPWTAKDVFELMPRLIEVGARVFPTEEWAERRTALFRAV